MHGLVDAAHVDHLHPDAGIAIATSFGHGWTG
jgi:rhamnulose-1-phosphate aldolase